MLAAVVCAVPRGRTRRSRASASAPVPPGALRAVGVVGATAIGWLVAPPASEAVVAAVSGIAAWGALSRLPDRSTRWPTAELRAVPLVLDLVAAVLATGQPVGAALAAATPAAGPRFAGELGRISGLLELGAAPREAWSGLVGTPLEPVAAVAIRSADSGIRLAAAWSELATELRADALTRATSRAAAAGTWVIAPLGLCFLPAFVCLGIAPVVLGLVRSLGGP